MQPSILRRLFQLSWPVMGLNVLQVLALAVDTAFVGRLPHAEAALTGLGFATQILFLLMVGMMGLTVGSVALVARAHGAGEHERVNHILAQSTQLTVLLGLAVAVLGNVLAVPLLSALGANSATMAPALDFLRPMLLGAAINYLNILYAAVLRGVGNTRLAFGVALLSNGLNAVFNYGLVLGHFGLPSFGLSGAAMGTVSSQFVAVAVLVMMLRRGAVPGVRPPLRTAPIDRALARQLIAVGAPAAIDMLVLNASFLSIVGMLGRVDQAAVAAHGLGMRVQALAFVPGMGVSQATAAMVGQALGAKNPAEARQVLRAAVLLCVGIMSSLAAMTMLGAPWLVGIFDVSPTSPIGAHSVTWMRLLGACMPIAAVQVAISGLLSGAGATRTNLRINFVATVLQIPLSAALGFALGLGALGVWLAFPLSFVVRAGMSIQAYRAGAWARTGATL